MAQSYGPLCSDALAGSKALALAMVAACLLVGIARLARPPVDAIADVELVPLIQRVSAGLAERAEPGGGQ